MPIQLLSEQQLQTLRMQQRTSAVSATLSESDEELALSAPLLVKRGVCVAALWARVAGYRHWLGERVARAREVVGCAMVWLRQNTYEPLASCESASDDEERAIGARTFRPATEEEICEKNASLSVRHERYLTHSS